MIIARNEKEVDAVLDHFISEGFESPSRTWKPSLEDWRDYIKEEYLKKSECGFLIFIPHWDYDVQENRIIKTLNWHAPDTLEKYLKSETEDEDKTTLI